MAIIWAALFIVFINSSFVTGVFVADVELDTRIVCVRARIAGSDGVRVATRFVRDVVLLELARVFCTGLVVARDVRSETLLSTDVRREVIFWGVAGRADTVPRDEFVCDCVLFCCRRDVVPRDETLRDGDSDD